MAIRVALNHKTSHRYARPVWLSPQVVRLRPAPHCRTPIVSYSIRVTPGEHFINWQQDPYSNYQARLVFPKKTQEFSIEIDLVAEMIVINPFDFFVEKHAEQFPFDYGDVLKRELAPYLETAPVGPKLQEFLAGVRKPEATHTINYLVELNQKLQQIVKYVIRLEPGIQEPEHTLTCLSGSCRDSAWLAVQMFRNMGLASRFVSGYLIQLIPDVKPLEGPAGASSDFTDLHAWVEVYIPGAGWVGLDPTSGLLVGEGHIPLAATAEPSSAAAITGFFSLDNEEVVKQDPEAGEHPASGEAKDEFHFSMSIKRVQEEARVTKPYTEAQWAEIEALGHKVDEALKAGDVRLTMGGEPTFIAIDNAHLPEWNTDAHGAKKYEIADQLVRRLRDRFGPGGFLHHGQGKWYPGESLPRWALGLYWRKDGKPIWRDKSLVADEHDKSRRIPTERDANVFITQLAGRLKADPKYVMPGYEDVFYYLWKERRLPVNVDPFESKLKNEEDRKRLAKVFEQGLDKVIGFCLPLKRKYNFDGTAAWVSGPWFFRPERMYLIPGDSAMGFRLPLDSIPWMSPADMTHVHAQDPMEPRGPLPDRDAAAAAARQASIMGAPAPRNPVGFMEQILDPEETEALALSTSPATAVAEAGNLYGFGTGLGGGAGDRPPLPDPPKDWNRDERNASTTAGRYPLPPAFGESAADLVRTALCAEVRNGALRIFVPPLRYIEDYLELVYAIEDTAAAMRLPVLIEGYTPPYDPRINQIGVTPDPGVIEVNTHPVEKWSELVENTTALYEEARQCRLGTEKFMNDGRHSGTGGGNHIVFGGASPADSPILRRPDLLRSMLGYWHNHPSLSYVFSGMFVGPTSQAPRVDEARTDQVYELELAFKQVPAFDKSNIPPWLVDRIFRNLLVDATGNTHRAEFCIDKLYSPDGATGRLGLLEMRGFEMPPHSRMSLTQHLLLRALIAKFWEKPYERQLVRRRTEIHDKFLLPYFVKQDIEDICTDLADSGFPMKPEWFSPHVDFRFPYIGSLERRGIVVELRQAIEPWHVLGETPGPGGTVRYVDSSLEKLEVHVRGMTDPRHIVTVNGVAIPMHPTGTNGEFVAGVRYRAWQPAAALHPTIKRNAPLTFDLLDTWNNRSVGGIQYHVSHPGGRSYTTPPINAYEAESRRIARFFKFGHTPGVFEPIAAKRSKEFPYTLDLRLHSV